MCYAIRFYLDNNDIVDTTKIKNTNNLDVICPNYSPLNKNILLYYKKYIKYKSKYLHLITKLHNSKF